MPIAPSVLKPKNQRRKSLTLRLIGFMFAAGMIVFLAGSAIAAYLLWQIQRELPNYEVLARYEPMVMTRIHANDGSLIAEYARERRIFVPINTIPDVVINAFLSAEDKNFYKHTGLDWLGIGRALVTNLQNYGGDRRMIGASTITQQVAKNFLLSSDRTVERKIKEAILAVRIERAYTKERILELYLNEIFLGLSSYGVAAAALNYYGKKLEELTPAEAAYLAALPKAPNNYHPFRHTQRALDRRNWVLRQMFENGHITEADWKSGRELPLNVNPRPFGAHIFAAEYFAEEVRRELFDAFGEQRLYGGGLSVRTTLDPRMQRLAKKALVNGLVDYDRRQGWRGALQRLELAAGEEWGAALAKIEPLADVKPWRLAVVLNVTDQGAEIGLRPRTMRNGQSQTLRETGTILFSEMKWAKPVTGQDRRIGRAPKKATDVLAVGDVIYVAPVTVPEKGKKGRVVMVEGQWSLMQIPEVGGGVVAMDPHTGRVLAQVGGFSYHHSQFDRAIQANRQPGSSFKPFVYVAALDNGYTPASVILDAPIVVEQRGQDAWKPKNYSDQFYGPSTLRLGIEKSRNLMTVRLAQDMGMPLIAEYARRFGIYDQMMPVLSMSLGAGETTLLRMTTAYATLANGGKQVRATLVDRIQDRYGRTVWRHDTRQCPDCAAESWQGQNEPALPDDRLQIVDPHSAYQITSMMEGVIQRGTGTVIADLGKPLAGKTGTTNEERDAWFIGYSPDLVVGVFVGFDTPRPMGKGETGGGVAAPIFKDFMAMALDGKPAVPFRQPPGLKLIRINPKTGLRAEPGDRSAILEAFKPSTEPPDAYSVIGFTSQDGRSLVDPNQGALTSGTGGLY